MNWRLETVKMDVLPGDRKVSERGTSMNPLIVPLVILSAFMHAGWNLLTRHQRSEMIFFDKMLFVIALVGFAPAILSEVLTHSLKTEAWICVVGSGFCCGLYSFFLARAYGSSDFTLVYPVARSLPVLLVAVGDVFRGRHPSPLGWLGMVLVVFGCFLAPLHSGRDISFRRYFNRASGYMLLAALGTVGYTLLDKVASEIVLQGPATAARYGYVFFFFTYIGYRVLGLILKGPVQEAVYAGWRLPILAAVLNFGAYWLILWAYQLAQRASYIIAFRQFSVVLGVVLAFAIYKEKGVAIRLVGTGLIFSGLVIIGWWGS